MIYTGCEFLLAALFLRIGGKYLRYWLLPCLCVGGIMFLIECYCGRKERIMPTVKDIVVSRPGEGEVGECHGWPIWECEASEFSWDYTATETCLLIEGAVTVSDRPETGESVSFGVGDKVVFPVGLKCVWKITADVRKHYSFS